MQRGRRGGSEREGRKRERESPTVISIEPHSICDHDVV